MQTRRATFPWRKILILSGVIAFCLLLASSLIYQRLYSAEAMASTPAPTAAPSPGTFRLFVGQWYAHYGVFTFKENGQATLQARAYKWCGPGVSAPCDSWNGNTIVPGIAEEMVFTRVGGNTAYGKIISSTTGNAGTPVTVTLQENNTVRLSDNSVFCGPKSPPGTCGV